MLLLTINGRIIIIINMYKKRINMNIVRTLKTIFKGVAFMLKEEYLTHYCGKLSFTAIMGASVFGFLIKKTPVHLYRSMFDMLCKSLLSFII